MSEPDSGEGSVNRGQPAGPPPAALTCAPGGDGLVEETPGPARDPYRLLFEKNPQPSWVFDRETFAFLAVNEAAVRRYGYSRDEFLAMAVPDILAADGVRREPGYGACAAAGRHRKKDGTVLQVEISQSPVSFQGKDACLVVVNDVTERKRAEEALREREAYLRQVLGQMPAVVWTTDPQLRFTSGAGAGLAVLNLEPDELRGFSLFDYFRTKDEGFLPISAHLRALQGESASYEMEWAGRSYQTRVEPLRTAHGVILGCIGTAVDITERKWAEEALRRSEERHRIIAELTSDYSYTCHVEADGRVVMDSATEGFVSVTGYTVEELQAAGDWPHLVHPDDLPALEKMMPTLLHGGRHEGELRVVTKGGETRWIRYSTHPTWDESQGRVTRVLGAAQDITCRKKAEAALQEYARRLQALSRRLLEVQEEERRYFARELHDEVGQALTGLKLSLEMSARLSAEGVKAGLAEAQGLVRDLTGRVRDLSLRLRPTMLDDLGLVSALLWHFERYQAQTGVKILFEHRQVQRRFPAEVETAAYRIIQEALTNVARYAGVGEVTVRAWLDEGRLCVQVEDHGCGFDRGAVLTRGSSSGLSGMQERAVLLGGHFDVESRPGAGTRLLAELPVQRGEEERGHVLDDRAGG